MAIKPATVVEYSRELQRLEVAPERAQKVAGELERLVAGIFALADAGAISDDPADFLTTLAALRDTAGADDE